MAPVAVLVGPPGSGKSTIGRRVARRLGVGFTDTDAEIERTSGRSIAAIFATEGEPGFRLIERQVVSDALGRSVGVVSLGGGAVLSEETRAILKSLHQHGTSVIYLDVSVAEGIRRVSANNNRPMLAGEDRAARYRAILEARRPLYTEVASVVLRTDHRGPVTLATRLIAALPEAVVPRTRVDAAKPKPKPGRRPRRRGGSHGHRRSPEAGTQNRTGSPKPGGPPNGPADTPPVS